MLARLLPDRQPGNTTPSHGDVAPSDGMSGTNRTLYVSVQKWLLVLVLSGVIGIVLLALYGKWQVERIYNSASYANAHTVPKVMALTDAQAHFTRWRLALYRHVASGDEALAEQHDAQVMHERDATRRALDSYEALVDDAKERRGLELTRALLAEYELATPLVDEKIHAGQSGQALNILLAQAAAADRVIQVLDVQIAADVAQGREAGASAMQIFNRASWATLAFVLMVVSVLLAVGYVIGRRIAEQVDRIRALARESEIFRAMVECVRDQPVTVHDLDDGHRIVYANATACRYFGTDLETLLTWTPIEFDPHANPGMLQKLVADWRNHGSLLFESEHRIASGELIPVEVASSFFEHDGRKLAICFTRDLRPRMEAEARMLEMERVATERESMRRMTRFAQSAPGFMCTVEMRLDGSIAMTYASPAVENIYGLGLEDVLEDMGNIYALIVPEDLEKVVGLIEESFSKQSAIHVEYRIQHPSKGLRWIEANSMPDRMENGSMQWHGFVTDITERKAMEESLAQRERDFRALAENAPDNICRYDRESRIVYMNPELERTLGLTLEEAVGQRTDERYPQSESMLRYQAVLQQVLATGVPTEFELVSDPVGDGRSLYDLIRMAPEFDEHGQVSGVVAIGRDYTEQKRLELELSRREQEFRALSENSPDMIVRYDLDCRRIYVNQAFLDATGATAEEVLGKPVSAIAWWSVNCSAEDFERHLRHVMETREPASVQLFGYTPSTGQPRHTMARIVPELDGLGRPVSLIAVVRDVTELVQLQMEIAGRERQMRTLVENTPDVIIRYDRDCRRRWVSSNYTQVYGSPVEAVLGKKPTESWGRPNMSPAEYERRLMEVMETGVATDIELEWVAESGEYVCQSLRVVPELNVTGQVDSVLALSRDVSEIKRTAMSLLSREQEFRTLVELSPDTICRYDTDGRRVYANPKMIEDFRVPTELLLGKTPTEFPGGEFAQTYEQRIAQVVASGEAADFELPWSNVEGKQFCSHVRLTPEFDREGGSVTGVLAVGRDITEIDEYRRRVHRMAFYDALTNLPNRSLLNDRIGQTIADAAYHGHRFGLMILDLDGFKAVNDTLGHGVGDLLLHEVGKRLLGCVRIYDTVARLGGDEFAVLVPEVREDGNLAVVARKILEALAEPFNTGGKELFISASIGIALYPSDNAEIDGLFRYADSAMYHAKKQGRNNFQFYSEELTARSGERMALESDLRRARKKKELELYYQPQVDLVSGRLVGAEALLRWNRGTHGMVTPDRFIPIAEETGLIVGIGEWVLETACEAAVAWNTGRKVPLKVAVNLSTRQFVRNDLAQSLRTILANTGCQPAWLGLEITESLLLDDAEEIRATLAEFDAMGLSIAIDDFGTGYSALGYLNRFPVSVLKIDRSFVRDITTDRDRAELVKAIISMARSLRMGLVAEGVETDAQAAYLHNLGCHVAQGYLFSKPVPRAEFEVLLNEGSGTLITT